MASKRSSRGSAGASRPLSGRARVLHLAVLVEVDQLAQRAFVGSEAVGRVETAQAAAAQRAAAFGIQRKRVLKRRPATDAEELRAQAARGVSRQFAANRDSALTSRRGSPQMRQSVGEEKGKKGVGG